MYVLGIGGLAVAYVLSSAGHRVRVLEKHDLNVPSGGHRVPPNFSKILRQWVGEEELHRLSTPCVGSPFHRCESLTFWHATLLLPWHFLRIGCAYTLRLQDLRSHQPRGTNERTQVDSWHSG